jgi:hypothetical protein
VGCESDRFPERYGDDRTGICAADESATALRLDGSQINE